MLLLCVIFSHTETVSALNIGWACLLLPFQCTFISSNILNLINSIDHLYSSLLGLLVKMLVKVVS